MHDMTNKCTLHFWKKIIYGFGWYFMLVVIILKHIYACKVSTGKIFDLLKNVLNFLNGEKNMVI